MKGRISVPLLLLCLAGCSRGGDEKTLVLYTAGDRIFSDRVVEAFTKETGIRVRTQSDTEVDRGVGLRKRIVQEARSPRADVYWNNELVNTILLARQGLLASYKSPSAEAIPPAFADPQGRWTAFGARARVFLVNTDLVAEEDTPDSWKDFLDPKWRGKAGISAPTGGTTATHAASLFELWGETKAMKFYRDMRANGVVICNGNGHVMTQVGNGELHWGWTDTNDSNVAIRDGKPVKVVYPDQDEGGIGTLLIPHSVAMVLDAPHPENAKRFIDFLLRPETEEALARSISAQIPVRPGVAWPPEAEEHFVMDIEKIRSFNDRVDWDRVADRLVQTITWMNEEFLR
jgi:iron(III) transport system substrate-binding protein